MHACQSSDYLPYGCGGNPYFTAEKPAHSPSLNVLGAVCGNGESMVTDKMCIHCVLSLAN